MEQKLLVFAYPELSPGDYSLIENHRKQHDSLQPLLGPHFTLVFPVKNISEKIFIDEIEKQLKGIESFSFTIRCATINKDAFAEKFYTFLVPDEGHSRIVKLHDKLYSGRLSEHLLLDVDFIPHITIGSSNDIMSCKKMADDWNSRNIEITGKISHIDIAQYEGAMTLKRIKLLNK